MTTKISFMKYSTMMFVNHYKITLNLVIKISIKSIWLYAIQLWVAFFKRDIRQLQNIFLKVFRLFMISSKSHLAIK